MHNKITQIDPILYYNIVISKVQISSIIPIAENIKFHIIKWKQ